MIPFVADEDFHGAITRGLLRRGVDIVRVQDVQLRHPTRQYWIGQRVREGVVGLRRADPMAANGIVPRTILS